MLRQFLCSGTVGFIGTMIAGWFGGWDASLLTLVIFMGIDYVTGLVVAAYFNKSPKTESGKLESKASFKGLLRKCMILLFVLIGTRLDLVMGASYVRDGICIAFMANELISITENAALMGIPLPDVLINAINVLKSRDKKEEQGNDEN
jgi:toxin secretion/phage lysis holin